MKEHEIRKKETFDRYLQLVAQDVDKYFAEDSAFVKVDCPACKSPDYDAQFKKNRFTYVLCRKCATLFVNPRPPFDDLIQFYANSESTAYFVNDFFKPVAEVRREKIFRPRAEYIAQRFAKSPIQTIGDIGAGFGLFLDEIKKLMPEKRFVAIEPSEEMVEICKTKGLEVLPCVMEDVVGYDEQFDLLCSFELFEHLYDPELFLKKVHQLLKKGGHFLFTTLSGTGFDIQLLWEKSKSVSPPHHLNFFNPKSAALILERCGFKVVEAATPGQLDWDIVEGAMTRDGMELGRFWKNLSGLMSAEAKEELQRWISKNLLSSHMRILAVKI